jgi:hypothetical protein
VRKALRTACEPATMGELGDCITFLIQSIPQSAPADGYSGALTMDVGSLQPSRGALEAASRRLRATAMFRPKIPEGARRGARGRHHVRNRLTRARRTAGPDRQGRACPRASREALYGVTEAADPGILSPW